MYEVEIGESIWPAYAFVKADDLEEGISKIYVGDMSKLLHDVPFAVEHAESIITHESIHIAIYKATENLRMVGNFDTIDNAWDKSDVYVYSRPFE